MRKTRKPYPPEFRAQMVELVRSGRTPEELSPEIEPSVQSISTHTSSRLLCIAISGARQRSGSRSIAAILWDCSV